MTSAFSSKDLVHALDVERIVAAGVAESIARDDRPLTHP